MKNAESEVDFNNKATIQRILRLKFGIPALMDEVLFISKQTGQLENVNQSKFESKEEIFKYYWVHLPDLQIKVFSFPMVCEVDGDVHWQNSKAVKQTNERNFHYELAGIKMLWLTRNEAELPEEQITKLVSIRLSTILGFEPVRLS